MKVGDKVIFDGWIEPVTILFINDTTMFYQDHKGDYDHIFFSQFPKNGWCKYEEAIQGIKCKCSICGNTNTVIVSMKGYKDWKSGMLIQKALPECNADDRELLISGICPKCYNEMMQELQ